MTTGETTKLLDAAKPFIEMAIVEDIGPGDATSESVLPVDLELHGRIFAKKGGIIAGLPIAEEVFGRVEPALRFVGHVSDGDLVSRGQIVAEVFGPGRGMLAAERIALNFLQQLSGIATLTRVFVDAIADSGATILDTRKTRPGYRALEKYAVRMGGGQNHRMSLHDMLLIKDNHIEAAGSITDAVARSRQAYPDLPVEVEVKDLEELEEALLVGVDRIMLDNMTAEQMQEAAEQLPAEEAGEESFAEEIGVDISDTNE